MFWSKLSNIIFSYIFISFKFLFSKELALISIPLNFFKKILAKCVLPEYFSPYIFTKFFSHFGQLLINLNA